MIHISDLSEPYDPIAAQIDDLFNSPAPSDMKLVPISDEEVKTLMTLSPAEQKTMMQRIYAEGIKSEGNRK